MRQKFISALKFSGLLLTVLFLFLMVIKSPSRSDSNPEMVLQLGHAKIVRTVAFSNDSSTLATGSEDGTVKLWDARTGDLKRTLELCGQATKALAFTPDCKFLLTSGNDPNNPASKQGIIVWNVNTGNISRRFQTERNNNINEEISTFALSPDGKTLVIARGNYEKSTLMILNFTTGELLEIIAAHDKPIYKLAFAPTSKSYASASFDGTIKWWDCEPGQLKRTFKGQGKEQFAIAFSPDGKTLAGASIKSGEMVAVSFISLWDLATGKVIRTMVQGGIVSGMAFLPDGQTLISGGGMLGVGELQFWDVKTGKSKRDLWGNSNSFTSIALSPDGKRLAAGDFTLKIRPQTFNTKLQFIGDTQILDVVTAKVERTLKGYERPVVQAAFSPDGKQIVDVSTAGPLKLWNAQSGAIQINLEGNLPIAFSPDSQTLASGASRAVTRQQRVIDTKGKPRIKSFVDFKSVIALRNAKNGSPRVGFNQLPNASADQLAFSPDGKNIAVQSYGPSNQVEAPFDTPGIVQLWDAKTGKAGRKWNTLIPLAGGNTLTFSPDGSLLATCGADATSANIATTQLWSVATGKLQRSLKIPSNSPLSIGGLNALKFSPDGKNIVGRNGAGWFCWSVQTGNLLKALSTGAYSDDGADSATSNRNPISISRDGKLIATETPMLTIRLWDMQTGRLKRELSGHSGGIYSLDFSPDGKSLVSGSADGTIKVWSSQTGQLKATLISLPDSASGTPQWLSVTPNGRYTASAQASKFIRWRVGNELHPAADYESTMRDYKVVHSALNGN